MIKNILLFVLLASLNVFSQDKIPNIDLKTMEGKTISFHEVTNQNNVIIISLWATWCVPCIKELDAISDVYEEWQKETGVLEQCSQLEIKILLTKIANVMF